MKRREVVYRLGGVNPNEGIDVRGLVKYLNEFDDLVRVTAREAGYDGELQIRVKPFKEGSFITEFIVESGVVDFLTSDNVDAILKALEILGLCYGGAKSLPKIVRRVRGAIEKYTDNEDGSFTYGEGADAVTVDETTHRAVQNPAIAEMYRDIAIGPVAEFSGIVQQVNIYMRDPESKDDGLSEGATFTNNDTSYFSEYVQAAKVADESEITETSHLNQGVWLRPVSGSYAGDKRGYTFLYGIGDDVIKYKNVRIDDTSFLEKLADGSIRFNSGDLLQVDLEVIERTTKSGKKKNPAYRITSVRDYMPLEMPQQETFADYLARRRENKNSEEIE